MKVLKLVYGYIFKVKFMVIEFVRGVKLFFFVFEEGGEFVLVWFRRRKVINDKWVF